MKGFNKLVLASAIIAASSASFAMQSMDDESMSATTGQDGLTVTLDTNLSNLKLTYIDRDGLTGSTQYNPALATAGLDGIWGTADDVSGSSAYTGAYTNGGAIVIDPIGVTSTGVQIKIDAGGDAGDTTGNGMLQVQIFTPGTTSIILNDGTVGGGTKIGVADSYDSATAARAAAVGNTGSEHGAVTNVISFGDTAQIDITGSATDAALTIQLGRTDQGAMIKAVSNIPSIVLTGGLSINDADAVNGGGAISINRVSISNIHSVASIDVNTTGLRIDTTGTTIGEVGLERVVLGAPANAAIGDIYISGLTSSGVITVAGH